MLGDWRRRMEQLLRKTTDLDPAGAPADVYPILPQLLFLYDSLLIPNHNCESTSTSNHTLNRTGRDNIPSTSLPNTCRLAYQVQCPLHPRVLNTITTLRPTLLHSGM